ncbi:MAG TPA: DUF1223 domain-containing protein [Chthoniobacterales bacterium]|nr:DUF1223 domain-containing protein [Chthoniobacterales bacterium]
MLLTARIPAAEIILESKPTRAHLIELYTSEGCSSCPPAEEWMNGLKNHPRLWQDIVPIAFHVDYWDHRGWRDPFASKTWTERQADYSVQWKKGSVYTPGFVLNGNEWHYGPLPAVATETPGVLTLKIDGDRVLATFKPSAKEAPGRSVIHLVRLGFGYNTAVTAGENNGRKLVHDFVALGLVSETLKAGAKELRLPAGSTIVTADPRNAVVAWVTAAGKMEAIQAVGGWLQ